MVGEVKPNVKKKKEAVSKKPEKRPKSERKNSPTNWQPSPHDSDVESDGDIELETSFCTLSTSDLGGPDCSLRKQRRKKVKDKTGTDTNRKLDNAKKKSPRKTKEVSSEGM